MSSVLGCQAADWPNRWASRFSRCSLHAWGKAVGQASADSSPAAGWAAFSAVFSAVVTRRRPREDQFGDQVPAAIPGGLEGLLRQFQQNGYGHVADSWIGRGPNQQIAPDQLQQALGPDVVDELSDHSGMPRQDVLSQLSQALPDMVDRLTPEGRIPDHAEVARW